MMNDEIRNSSEGEAKKEGKYSPSEWQQQLGALLAQQCKEHKDWQAAAQCGVPRRRIIVATGRVAEDWPRLSVTRAEVHTVGFCVDVGNAYGISSSTKHSADRQ